MKKEEEKQEQIDLIPEERLKDILSILFPWGYSHYNEVFYTGVSPFIGDAKNVITVIANDPAIWGSVFSICMERFDEDCDEADSLGYYKGIMKLIAPELHSATEHFQGSSNVLDFDWAPDNIQNNAFPAKVIHRAATEEIEKIK